MGLFQSKITNYDRAEYVFGNGTHVRVRDGTRIIASATRLRVTMTFSLDSAIIKKDKAASLHRLRTECQKLFLSINEIDWFRHYDDSPALNVYERVQMRVERVEKSSTSRTRFEITFLLNVKPRGTLRSTIYEVAAHIATSVSWAAEGGGLWADADRDNYMTLTDILFIC